MRSSESSRQNRSALYQTLYLLRSGKQAHEAPNVGLLALLARYYNEVADLRPQLDLIPLFPFASWSLGASVKYRIDRHEAVLR